MKSLIQAVVIVASLAASATVFAQSNSRITREQVRAELREAQRTGNIVAGGESGQKLNELYPNRYPAKAMN